MSEVAAGFKANGMISLPRKPKLTTLSCRATNIDMEKKTNLYKVLSLESETVGLNEIKKAYRSMAHHYHPDVCPPSKKEESTRMFLELHRAYETLSDPVLRMRYDTELKTRGTERKVRSEFSKETWEAQLSQLRKRSDRRENAGYGRA